MNALHVVTTVISLLHPHPPIDAHQAYCLAKNIYWEAHEEHISVSDRIKVANTTLVRAEQSGKPICSVVYAVNPGQYRHQFSWLDGGEPDLNKTIHSSKAEMTAFELAAQIAVLKLAGDDLGDNSKPDGFYSPQRVKSIPAWMKEKTVVSSSKDFIFVATIKGDETN